MDVLGSPRVLPNKKLGQFARCHGEAAEMPIGQGDNMAQPIGPVVCADTGHDGPTEVISP